MGWLLQFLSALGTLALVLGEQMAILIGKPSAQQLGMKRASGFAGKRVGGDHPVPFGKPKGAP
jgi:hypothetical protein